MCNMKRFLSFLLFVALFVSSVSAQYFPVDTARLNSAYRELVSGNRTLESETEFLEAYPTTWLEFYMTYSYVDDENYDYSMCKMCCEHISTLFTLSKVNDTVLCKKIVDLTVGMKEVGECTSFFQDNLVGYILGNDKLVLDYLSKLKKGYQMEFWQFCWSTVTECDRAEIFKELYARNKRRYPEQMKMSLIAFQYFYDGINYPELFPYKNGVYYRKFVNRDYKDTFDDYIDYGGE